LLVHFISLGCDKNLVDSEIMLGILSAAGHTITDEEQRAEVIVINTCGFIAEASQESVETILRMARNKRGSCKALVVTGCMAERYKEEIFKEIPEVDAVVGVGDFEEISRAIDKVCEGGKHKFVSGRIQPPADENILKRMVSTPPYMAYLKIAEGCDNRCAYCAIPSIRGPYRSRPLDSLLAEARGLAAGGVRELVLVAQDTALYGADLGAPALPLLLARLAEIDGLAWLRVMYCYPEHITDELITELRDNPKVCRYLDIPVQHSEDAVLKRMKRASSKDGLRGIIGRLRRAMPDIALRTTLMVGFPGETAGDFSALLDFMAEIQFDRLGVFEYSREDGTEAASMSGQISASVKRKRKNAAMRLQMDISAQKNKHLIAKTMDVIVDGKLPDVYCGRTYRDAYEVDGMVFFESAEELMSGEFVTVRVTGASQYDLTGEILR
jgi:ribosomal protein S12 methylthiotransferase